MLVARRATLPPPSKVVADTWELIVNPFYDNGGNDKGLFWHLYASAEARRRSAIYSRPRSASHSAC